MTVYKVIQRKFHLTMSAWPPQIHLIGLDGEALTRCHRVLAFRSAGGMFTWRSTLAGTLPAPWAHGIASQQQQSSAATDSGNLMKCVRLLGFHLALSGFSFSFCWKRRLRQAVWVPRFTVTLQREDKINDSFGWGNSTPFSKMTLGGQPWSEKRGG